MTGKTVEDFKARCVIDEHTGCWLWRGAMSRGRPNAYAVRADGARITTSAQKLCFEAFHEEELSPGKIVYRVICDNKQCINPMHCAAMTRKELGAWNRKRGTHKGKVSYVRSNTALARQRSQMTIELAREIRASTDSNREVSRRLGFSESVVSSIRRGRTWRDQAAANSSVFAWRPTA